MAWLFVPGLEASNEELNESFLNAEPFAMSRGKPMPPQSWRRKWDKGGFIRHLFGATYEPSTASRGVASWIGSLEDSRANPSALQGNNWEKTTPGTFGLNLSESLARFDRASCSWKTCQASLNSAEPPSLQTWPISVIVSRGRLFGLPMLEPLTTVEGGSVLRTPTAKANLESPSFQKWPSFQRLMYPTPTTQDSENNGGPSQMKRHTKPLNAVVGGRLNPEFVEWLMGWPIGWTACEHVETESSLNRPKPPFDTSSNA
jgi:hypothetical protein